MEQGKFELQTVMMPMIAKKKKKIFRTQTVHSSSSGFSIFNNSF
jgi:hypothetical protein